MRKLLMLTAAVALIAATSTGFAAALTKTGTIKAFDAKTHMLSLDTGDNFVLPKTMKPGKLKVGSKVIVTYVEKNGAMDATKIVAAH